MLNSDKTKAIRLKCTVAIGNVACSMSIVAAMHVKECFGGKKPLKIIISQQQALTSIQIIPFERGKTLKISRYFVLSHSVSKYNLQNTFK